MKHEPKPAIHMEKQLGWGRISGDLQDGSNSVNQVDGISDMAPVCQLCRGKVIELFNSKQLLLGKPKVALKCKKFLHSASS